MPTYVHLPSTGDFVTFKCIRDDGPLEVATYLQQHLYGYFLPLRTEDRETSVSNLVESMFEDETTADDIYWLSRVKFSLHRAFARVGSDPRGYCDTSGSFTEDVCDLAVQGASIHGLPHSYSMLAFTVSRSPDNPCYEAMVWSE